MVPEELLALIRRFEGLRLKVYLCPAGVPTIGYGHTGPEVRLGMPDISEAVAEGFLLQDAAGAWAMAGRLSPRLASYPLKQAAIADFIFNLGAARYKASTLRRRVDAGDWEGAAAEFRKWVWGGGRKLPGLVARREVGCGLLLS